MSSWSSKTMSYSMLFSIFFSYWFILNIFSLLEILMSILGWICCHYIPYHKYPQICPTSSPYIKFFKEHFVYHQKVHNLESFSHLSLECNVWTLTLKGFYWINFSQSFALWIRLFRLLDTHCYFPLLAECFLILFYKVKI